ncbi:type II secretion system protein [Vibrio maerlii]|uniref:type II secretion system protein n=1 Tax=Vibrio maerlii TaxID=2231648 RepID=UPI000E3DFBCC|nr:type II secretion system protein [Vibrio maerlii]
MKPKGFTLIELIVVTIVLGILAITALPRFMNFTDNARISSLESLRGMAREVMNNVEAIQNIESRVIYKDDGQTPEFVRYTDSMDFLLTEVSGNYRLEVGEICRAIGLIDERLGQANGDKDRDSRDGRYKCKYQNSDNLYIIDLQNKDYCLEFKKSNTGTIYNDASAQNKCGQ